MRGIRYIGLMILLLLFGIERSAAQNQRNDFVIENDNMILTIDLKLKKEEIDSLLRIADIHGISVDNLLNNEFSQLLKDGWEVRQSGKKTITLIKPLAALLQGGSYQMLTLPRQSPGGTMAGIPVDVSYGINKFFRQSVHELPGGYTRFFLRGNITAKKVLLSGSFNNWSTSKGTMFKTDSGWISDIKLDAGEHLYKFIINGNWTEDHDNALKEPDGHGGFNSIYFRYNYVFKLNGHAAAQRVMVAGSFNNWNANEIVMIKQGATWQMSLYLKETVHTYRFMVDGKWMPDPANPKMMADGKGNINSILQLGPVFSFKLPGFANARDVFVAGQFNEWRQGELRLKKDGNAWRADVPMDPGNYGYKFIVDGKWMTDPTNPCQYGNGDERNSLLVVKPNYTFTLKGYGNAKTIRLAGTFNNWDYDGYTMVHQGDQWTISLHLKPGKYLYKFIVDGNWIIDPANKLWEQNRFGTGNSVLWLEP
ncbi:glycogen-binding domain-containing protein [uncultured Mucilaginibacter sp.]|uniref:glycogen-binding domain-containing protein n=1 Tax=uncultured Mucilaginibacter sp. TaxID=797541 RepID=UPI0025E36E30|nr:glycogen-binding domain-containing protein [uncultured Mucilaginibacter sp.]